MRPQMTAKTKKSVVLRLRPLFSAMPLVQKGAPEKNRIPFFPQKRRDGLSLSAFVLALANAPQAPCGLYGRANGFSSRAPTIQNWRKTMGRAHPATVLSFIITAFLEAVLLAQ